ncbi:MAG: hypothetical protein EA425_14325 [Puniceicoccaceae bacterium]|nr:MAG: hypothetical protein EA425_14325 [Puniceicoccaceae bacterium]
MPFPLRQSFTARILWLAALLFSALPAAAGDLDALRERATAEPENPELLMKLGMALTDEAALGSESAVLEAIDAFQRVLELVPDSPPARVYLGNAYVMRARDVSLFRKPGYASRGFREMDRAVAAAPDDPSVRLIRAVNSYHVPRFLNRRSLAQEDFPWLVEQARSDQDLGPELRRLIFFHAGAFALMEDQPESVTLLARADAINAKTPGPEQVQTMLEIARRRHHDESAHDRP